ncbi:HET-domain-containing protein [Rhizodiscina lignyota]|uniref:HET-domain-containing protein n=1 Tax=Rhizodiscina lignyota TaxID=1504668 RepID=A0A9P4M3N4_9PEZI|nr:HET-domain-containing protein [Rhizodiscina lignyota]
MPEAYEEIWQDADDENSTPRKYLNLCDSCQNIMTSPTNIKQLKSQTGLRLCSGSQEVSNCALRAIALESIGVFNARHPGHINQDDDGVVNVFGRKLGKGVEWYDIDTLELRYFREDSSGLRFTPLLEFDVLASPDDPAAEYISTRPPELNMLSEQSFNRIKRWITDCEKNHINCPAPSAATLPTRVIDVGVLEQTQIARVYETAHENGRYVALSYCWGGPQMIALTTATRSQMERGICISSLPRTLQDAIFITRMLGLRYIWVDSMCIIQDDPADKEKELKAMAQIYRDAFVTISAASTKSCQDGFLARRKPKASHYPRFTLPYCAWDDESKIGSVVLQQQFYHDFLTEPINKRAWTLQERLLSPRILIYGTHELWWQCQAEQLSNGGTGKFYDPGAERLLSAFFQHDKETLTHKEWWYSWVDTVIDYTHRELSFEEDKLVAISAIASQFQAVQSNDYLAGLWKSTLLMDLTWMIDPSKSQPLKPRPSKYVAPSWSWAAVQGTVSFASSWSSENEASYAEVSRCETTLSTNELPTGRVTAGFLEARAKVKEARWRSRTTDLLDYEPYDQSKTIGRAWMDAEEEKPERLFCIRLERNVGLIVTEQSPCVFQRVGFFEIIGESSEESVALTDKWFEQCDTQIITII